jgi:hypothetical protein
VHLLLVEEQQDGRAYVATWGASAAGAAVSATTGSVAAGPAVPAGTAVTRVEVLGRVVEVLVEGLVAVATRLLREVLVESRVAGLVPVSMLVVVHGELL